MFGTIPYQISRSTSPGGDPDPLDPPAGAFYLLAGQTSDAAPARNDSQRLASAFCGLAGITLAADLAHRTSARQGESNRECKKAAL